MPSEPKCHQRVGSEAHRRDNLLMQHRDLPSRFSGFPEAFPFERDTLPQAPARFVQSEPYAECGSAMLREPCPTSAFQATTEQRGPNPRRHGYSKNLVVHSRYVQGCSEIRTRVGVACP